MKAVILAAGKGTRLASVARDIPKPMVPVCGTPVLVHQIELLKRHGITDIIIHTSHLGHIIEEALGDGAALGVTLTYVPADEPVGTSGALSLMRHLLSETFLVLYGDVMMNLDLHRLLRYHAEKRAAATLVVHPNDHPFDSDLVDVDHTMRIVTFLNKPHKQGLLYRNLANACLYVLEPEVLTYIEDGVKQDFISDTFATMLKTRPLYAYSTPEYLKDMGTPDRLAHVEHDVKNGTVAAATKPRACIFLDRDGVLNHDKGLIATPTDMRVMENAPAAVKLINKSGYLAVVITNQPVIARGLCTMETLGEIHKVVETTLGDAGAKLDAIYFCPHHPEKGFPGEVLAYKIDCMCRKPKPGMILQAARDLNIDLSRSFMIGDSARDAGAAKAAGVTFIGVRTGVGCSDVDVSMTAHVADDVLAAVQWILR